MGNSPLGCFGAPVEGSESSMSSSSSSDSCSSSPRQQERAKKHRLVRDGLQQLPESKNGAPVFKLVISQEQLDEVATGQYRPSKIDYLDHLVTTVLKHELDKIQKRNLAQPTVASAV